MKDTNMQLALFGGVKVTLSDGRGVNVVDGHKKTGYKKAGKGWKGKRDKNGYALDDKGHKIPTWEGALDAEGYCLNPDGSYVVNSQSIKALPKTAKDGRASFALATGLAGEALDAAYAARLRELAGQVLTVITQAMASGNYTAAANALTMSAKGDFVARFKYTGSPQSLLATETMITELVKRGIGLDDLEAEFKKLTAAAAKPIDVTETKAPEAKAAKK